MPGFQGNRNFAERALRDQLALINTRENRGAQPRRKAGTPAHKDEQSTLECQGPIAVKVVILSTDPQPF